MCNPRPLGSRLALLRGLLLLGSAVRPSVRPFPGSLRVSLFKERRTGTCHSALALYESYKDAARDNPVLGTVIEAGLVTFTVHLKSHSGAGVGPM